MLDQEPDESLVRAERGAMNAEGDLIDVVTIFVAKIESPRLREIDLVGRNGKLASNRAPGLDIDLRPVKGRFIRDFDKVDSGILQHVARHRLSLFPKLRFIDKFLSELGRIMRRETHQIFLDPEELEIVQIHLVDGIELGFELLRRHVKMRVVHLHRAHPHQSKQLAALFVAITGPVLRQPQRQVAIASRNCREQLMMMWTVHRLEIVAIWLWQLRPFTFREDGRDSRFFEENLALPRLLPEISLKFLEQVIWIV